MLVTSIVGIFFYLAMTKQNGIDVHSDRRRMCVCRPNGPGPSRTATIVRIFDIINQIKMAIHADLFIWLHFMLCLVAYGDVVSCTILHFDFVVVHNNIYWIIFYFIFCSSIIQRKEYFILLFAVDVAYIYIYWSEQILDRMSVSNSHSHISSIQVRNVSMVNVRRSPDQDYSHLSGQKNATLSNQWISNRSSWRWQCSPCAPLLCTVILIPKYTILSACACRRCVWWTQTQQTSPDKSDTRWCIFITNGIVFDFHRNFLHIDRSILVIHLLHVCSFVRLLAEGLRATRGIH